MMKLAIEKEKAGELNTGPSMKINQALEKEQKVFTTNPICYLAIV